jgi:exodeoxyribonuclease-3
VRLLSYNIQRGGRGRTAEIVRVLAACSPDVVVLQEATRPDIVETLAREAGFAFWGARRGRSLAFLSRIPVAHHDWRKPFWSRHAFLEIELVGSGLRIFGVHLSAVHAAWTERRRRVETRALLAAIAEREPGFHLLVGDFNTLAPGEWLEVKRLPHRLRALVWLSGGRVRWRTIANVMQAGYVDAYRLLHPPEDPGFTFPVWDPHVRLDFLFLPGRYAGRLRSCEVVTTVGETRAASDHLPIVADLVVDAEAAAVGQA